MAKSPVSVPSLNPGKWTVNVNTKNSNNTSCRAGEKNYNTQSGPNADGHSNGYDRKWVWISRFKYCVERDGYVRSLYPGPADTGNRFTDHPGFHLPRGRDREVFRERYPYGILHTGDPAAGRRYAGHGFRRSGENSRQSNTTKGTYEFHDINQAEGNIAVNITPMMNDPIDVTIAGQVEEIVRGRNHEGRRIGPTGTATWCMSGT